MALACSREAGVVEWMGGLGVAEWRLDNTIRRLDDRFPRDVCHGQKLPWLKAACQEARLLGAAEVTTDHLVLALIGEPRSLIWRSVPRFELRRRLSRRCEGSSVQEMRFQPELLQICETAGEHATAEELLVAVLDRVSYPEISALAVRAGIEGMAGEESLDGIRLGMTPDEVREVLGEPGFVEGHLWRYRKTSVGWRDGVVRTISGEVLRVGVGVLRRGDSWLEAERVLGTRRREAWVHRGVVEVLMLGSGPDDA